MEIQSIMIIPTIMKPSIKHIITVVCDTQYQQTIEVSHDEEVKASFFVFSDNQATSCKVQVNLVGEKSSADIKLYSIVHNGFEVVVDGTISIHPQANQASGHLQEEILLIGGKSFTTTIPILDVRNNNVSASHGAKIHTFNKDNIFYLMARGLSEKQAKEVVLKGFIDSLFESENIEIKFVGSPNTLSNKEDIVQSIIEKVSKNNLVSV